jgi:hypothetical protein
MEVGILNTKPENRDDPLTKINGPNLPPTHSSSNKSNRHIHSASFGSASSTCSSNSSSSLSASGMAYSPAVRGHRDKYSSSGRTLNNTANIDNPYRKKSSSSDTTYAQNSFRYNENGTKENGHNANFSELDGESISNEPKSLEDYSHGTPIKLRERKKCARVNIKNGNGDNAQSYISHKPTSHRPSTYASSEMCDPNASNNYSHSVSPGSNSGKEFMSTLLNNAFGDGLFIKTVFLNVDITNDFLCY